jgi:hypothetical protein
VIQVSYQWDSNIDIQYIITDTSYGMDWNPGCGAVWNLACKRHKSQQDGTLYVHCPIDEAMKTFGLFPVEVYIVR